MKATFWNGPAFLAGHAIPAASIQFSPFMNGLGQNAVPQPSDFEAELASYKTEARRLPDEVAAPILDTLESCEIFMDPQNFVPMRIRGCLNSVLAQLRAAGVSV